MTFSREGMKQNEMKISLENILPSLAKSLYGDDWRISIRELLQNCHDALAEAELSGINKNGEGEIHIRPDFAESTLTFEDNGIGMTSDEVEEYMATVGAGRKREQIEQLSISQGADREILDRLIGQYGIGFLSSFIISDQVLVETKSRKDLQADGVKALFTGETNWYSDFDKNAQAGTRVRLLLKNDELMDSTLGETLPLSELLNFERLKQEVRKFGDLLPYPIYVHKGPGDEHGELCNAILAPWEVQPEQFDENRLRDFVTDRNSQGNAPIMVKPFNFVMAEDDVDAHGVFYIPRPDREAVENAESVSSVELFCRRMFITSELQALLPDWALFVGVILECPNLTPTLDRNGVVRHEGAFVALKQALGKVIVEALQTVAQTDRSLFTEIRNEHRERIFRALVFDYNETKSGEESFFRAMVDYLPFTIIERGHPQGINMTLPDYRKLVAEKFPASSEVDGDEDHITRLFYMENTPAVGQYRAMVVQKDIPVIQAFHAAEPPLLRAYQSINAREVSLEDVSDILDLYVDTVDQGAYESMKQFLLSLEGGAAEDVRATKFSPPHIPALAMIHTGSDEKQAKMLEQFLQETGGSLSPRLRERLRNEATSSRAETSTLSILLNENNDNVRYIRDHCAAGNELAGVYSDVLHEIFHMARAYAEPTASDSPHFFEHRNQVLLRVMKLQESLSDAESNLEKTRYKNGTLDKANASLRETNESLETEIRALTSDQNPPDMLQSLNGFLLHFSFAEEARTLLALDGGVQSDIFREHAELCVAIVTTGLGSIDRFGENKLLSFFPMITPEAGGQTTQELARIVVECAGALVTETHRFFADKREKHGLAVVSANARGSAVVHLGKLHRGNVAGVLMSAGEHVDVTVQASRQHNLFEEHPVLLSGSVRQALNPPQQLTMVGTVKDLHPLIPEFQLYAAPD